MPAVVSRRTGRHLGRDNALCCPPVKGARQTTAVRTGVRHRQNEEFISHEQRKEMDMPTLERVVRPRRNRISIEVPREFGQYTFKIVMIPIVKEEKPKYDFSDLVGKLQWKGDAVMEQRRLRDEW